MTSEPDLAQRVDDRVAEFRGAVEELAAQDPRVAVLHAGMTVDNLSDVFSSTSLDALEAYLRDARRCDAVDTDPERKRTYLLVAHGQGHRELARALYAAGLSASRQIDLIRGYLQLQESGRADLSGQ